MARKRRSGRGWWGERYRHSLAAKKGWRKRKHHKKSTYASSFPRKTKDTGGLFRPAKHEDIAEIVSFETPSEASKSANILLAEIQHTKDRQRALTVARALQYAANRAEASTRRKSLSPAERKEMLLIAKIYGNAAELGWKLYRKRFAENS